MALERGAFGWNSIGVRRRRPPDGPKRLEFRPRRVCRFASDRVGSAFLVRRDCLFPAVASLQASTSLVGAFVTGRFRATASGRHPPLVISRVFLSLTFPPPLAPPPPSHPP